MKPQDIGPFACSEPKKHQRKWGSSAVTVQCTRCTGGNSLCELLAPEEAPEFVPDQLQLEQIPEEDEEMEVGVPELQRKCFSK